MNTKMTPLAGSDEDLCDDRKLSNCSRRVHWSPKVRAETSTGLSDSLNTTSDRISLQFYDFFSSTFGTLVSQMAQLFYRHGKFCASHPWEVMVTFVSLAICMFTLGPLMYGSISSESIIGHSSTSFVQHSTTAATTAQSTAAIPTASNSFRTTTIHSPSGNFVSSEHYQQTKQPSNIRYVKTSSTQSVTEPRIELAEVIILAISRGLAIFYMYSQLRKLCSVGSKYVVGSAGLFTVFTSFVFISGVFNFLNGNLDVVQKALPFFILLSDFSKVILLSRFALSSATKEQIHENIARGMAILGPGLTLDTLVETLAIGMGTITGYPRLEEISYFSCMTYLVNYLVFMTIFPAALSLTLELAHDHDCIGTPVWHIANLGNIFNLEIENKPNPVIQRVKVVMSAGLMLVHTLRRWPMADGVDEMTDFHQKSMNDMATDPGAAAPAAGSPVSLSSAYGMEQILVLGFVLALTIKYIFFENKDPQIDYSESAEMFNFINDNDKKKRVSNKHVDNKDDASTSGVSETSSSTPSSTRPTTPTAAVEADIQGNRFSKPETPSILITSQDSDTESVIAEYRRKITESQMILSSADTSNNSSRAGSVKGMCIHRNHHLTPSSGLGSATDESSIQTGSECEGSEHSQSPSFFIGDDFCSDCYSQSPVECVDREVQTEPQANERRCGSALGDDHELQIYTNNLEMDDPDEVVRELNDLLLLLKEVDGCKLMTNREVQFLVENKKIPGYKLEEVLGDAERSVGIRRRIVEKLSGLLNVLKDVPFVGYNYSLVNGACCENVIGFIPVPLGVAGPLLMNGRRYYVPMATTEGCLVASTNRGCRVISDAGGLRSRVFADGMTRGPVLLFRSAMDACDAIEWLDKDENFARVKVAFDSTSRFARLLTIGKRLVARKLFLRFCAKTGDAMGMNMLSKGTECALEEISKHVHGLVSKCLSGNFCTDKKPSAVNWIQGRGKSVVCETVIPRFIVERTLKTTVNELVQLNTSKNHIGSAVAGSIGGNNAQAANIVAAIYIATGQDPAQTVGSSNCMTIMESEGEDLYISCTMPSIEVGTIGGGTVLAAQSACLKLLGIKGSSSLSPGLHSSELSMVVCGTVLAAELSLLAALANGDLVQSHMKHNRSNININLEATPAATLSLKR